MPVVDPLALSNDILANFLAFALPGGLWAFLFLLAWERGAFAESIGFGRKVFWLLLPGALLASTAILPFGIVTNDVVGVSLGGAAFPLAVGFLSVGRFTPSRSAFLARLLGALAVEAALALLLVLPVAAPLAGGLAGALGLDPASATSLLVLPVAVLVPLAVLFVSREGRATVGTTATRPGRVLAFSVALASAVLYTTFVASEAVPGLGIVEPFPYFLLPPVGAGAIAVLFAGRVFPGQEAFALPVAFLTTTLGVLLGADLLRQPPLYGSGPAGLYTIGGAGVFDLVYLSGLLALGTAFVAHRLVGRPLAPVGPALPGERATPYGRLLRSFRAGILGGLNESLAEAVGASHDAADQARRLLGLPPAAPARPWEGLAVPGWVVADQANLEAAARSGTSDGREGFRGWLTARGLVQFARNLGQSRFGPLQARILGFLVDLALVGAPAVAVWAVIVLVTPGGLDGVLGSLAFNAAIYAFIALAFLFRVIVESVTGSSPGKRAFGLAVRDRRLAPVGFLASLVRNVSVLPVLTVVGLGGALAVAFGLEYGSFVNGSVAGVAIPTGLFALVGVVGFLVVGVGLFGAVGALVISLTSERQRLGDLLAGTWVVRVGASVPPAATAGTNPSPAPPTGPGPSG